MNPDDKRTLELLMNQLRDIACSPAQPQSVAAVRTVLESIRERTTVDHDWADTLEFLHLSTNDLTQLEHIRDKCLQIHADWMDWRQRQNRRHAS